MFSFGRAGYFSKNFISSFNTWCHGSLVWYVANTQICPPDISSGENCSHFYSLKWSLICVRAGVMWKLGYLWHCHFTNVLYFPAANLRCGNNDLGLHSPPPPLPALLEPNPVILPVGFANEGYLMLFSLVKRYHCGWLCTSCHAGEKACLPGCVHKKTLLEGETVEKVLEIHGWGN